MSSARRRFGQFKLWSHPLVATTRAFGERLRNRNWYRTIEITALLLGILGVLPALFTFWIESDDRLSERTFRAWEIILAVSDRNVEETQPEVGDQNVEEGAPVAAGSTAREALEFLNRKFDGRFCSALLRRVSIAVTGNARRRCLFPAKEKAILDYLRLPRVNLNGINLDSAQLRVANLRGVTLFDAVLTNAQLGYADLSNADFTGADLTGAILNRAVLDDAIFWFADLTGAEIDGRSLRDASFCGANLSEVDFGESDLQGCNFENADLSGADLQNTLGLMPHQLQVACAEPGAQPMLPAGLTWRGKTKEKCYSRPGPVSSETIERLVQTCFRMSRNRTADRSCNLALAGIGGMFTTARLRGDHSPVGLAVAYVLHTA